jgi:hypothetical protein
MNELVFSIGGIASNHLLVLAERNALSLELLDVLQPREDLVLHDKRCLHLIFATLFDGERFGFERFDSSRSREINGDIRSAFDFLQVAGQRRSQETLGFTTLTRARDFMIQSRGSFGSEIDLPVPKPSEAFHLFRDSSFWSGNGQNREDAETGRKAKNQGQA